MKDEPWIVLPTARLIATTFAASALAAGLWTGGAAVLGYGGPVMVGGAAGAGITAAIASIIFLLTLPWVPKPASTTMILWLAADLLAMGLALGAGYLLYSATSPGLGLPPLLLGVALAFFLVLLGKAAILAAHVQKHHP